MKSNHVVGADQTPVSGFVATGLNSFRERMARVTPRRDFVLLGALAWVVVYMILAASASCGPDGHALSTDLWPIDSSGQRT
jgi:hypothetical protein